MQTCYCVSKHAALWLRGAPLCSPALTVPNVFCVLRGGSVQHVWFSTACCDENSCLSWLEMRLMSVLRVNITKRLYVISAVTGDLRHGYTDQVIGSVFRPQCPAFFAVMVLKVTCWCGNV